MLLTIMKTALKIEVPVPTCPLDATNFYKDKGGLPVDVRTAIFSVFDSLWKRENLPKCLDGHSHNRNESFNGIIWNRVLKANHVGIDVFRLGVYNAIVHFSDGTIRDFKRHEDRAR